MEPIRRFQSLIEKEVTMVQIMEAKLTEQVPHIIQIGREEMEIHVQNRLRGSLDYISPQGNAAFLGHAMSIMTERRSSDLRDRPQIKYWRLGRVEGEEITASMYFNPMVGKAYGCIYRGHDMVVEGLNLTPGSQFDFSQAVRRACEKGKSLMYDWVDGYMRADFLKTGLLKADVMICRPGIHFLMGALMYITLSWHDEVGSPEDYFSGDILDWHYKAGAEKYFYEDGTEAPTHFTHFLT